MNDEYTHSTQSPLEGPKYIKKYVQNKQKTKNKTAEQKLKDENQTGKITGQHSPDLGQAHEMGRGYISYMSTQPSP